MNGRDDTREVSVKFHGLMVARYHEGDKFLEIGVVRGAPGHVLTITGVDEGEIAQAMSHGSWRLEVQDARGASLGDSATCHKPEFFNRMDPGQNHPGAGEQGARGDAHTCDAHAGWVIDFGSEEFHGSDLEIYEDALAPVIRVRQGELRTSCRTGFLKKQQGTGEFSNFGYVAEIAEVRFSLASGQRLVLRAGSQVLWSADRPGEVLIANLPDDPHHLERQDAKGPSHMQNYYLAFPQPPSRRFEVAIAEGGQAQPTNTCPRERAPYPYRCGLIFATGAGTLLAAAGLADDGEEEAVAAEESAEDAGTGAAE